MKRHEICTQIDEWISELSKPQHSERGGRTILFNSMVLRRHYRQLREELAKLPVPEGLEDLERPFTATVSSPNSTFDATTAMATFSLSGGGGGGGNVGGGGGSGSGLNADNSNTTVNTMTTTISTSSVGHIDENSSSSDSNIPNIQIDSNDPLIISFNDII